MCHRVNDKPNLEHKLTQWIVDKWGLRLLLNHYKTALIENHWTVEAGTLLSEILLPGLELWTRCTKIFGQTSLLCVYESTLVMFTYVRKRSLPLECSYWEMEWKACNGCLIPKFSVKTFHFLSGEIWSCSHAELRQAEGWAAATRDKLETDGVRQMGGVVRCSLQAWGDHWVLFYQEEVCTDIYNLCQIQ